MGTLLMVLFMTQLPERHRGPAPAELPQISVTQEGPLVVPTNLVMKGMIGVFTAYTSLLVFGGKWIWKKRTDEVSAIKLELAATNERIKTELEETNRKYELNRVETNAMIVRLDSKVDRHHEAFTEKIDKNHSAVMEAIATIHERRQNPRE